LNALSAAAKIPLPPIAQNPMDKCIEIKNLVDPRRTFERLDNEFIDIMYPDHFSEGGIVMLLDVNIDPLRNEDIIWIKELLDTVLQEIGETNYYLTPFNHEK